MIEETGTVIELKEQGIALVRCTKNSACDHCPSVDSCNMGGDSSQLIEVEVFNQAGAVVNDRVKVVTSVSNFLQSSLMLYIVPVVCLVIGAAIGQVGGSYTRYDPSLVAALLGVLFLIASFLGIRLLTRNWQRERFMPRIVAILPTLDAKECHHGN
jgi:sigma-E factor negative regulatory protein RseC